MSKPDINSLIHDLKVMIIDECDKEDDIELEDFTDDMPLFGFESEIELDSLDTLQISMAIQKIYGVRIEGAGAVRNAMPNVQTLAEHLLASPDFNT